MKIIGVIVIVIVSFILSTGIANAQDTTFEASVDKTRMAYEDVLVLSFVVSGGNTDLNVTPELPDLGKDFDVIQGPGRSTSISIINGRQSSSLTLQYILSPKKTGTLIIQPATLQYNGKTYTTQPISVEVIKGAQSQFPSSPQDSSTQSQGEGTETTSLPDLYIRAEIDKETAYIGEQVTLSYALYTRVNIADYTFTQQPNFTGFWVEELEIPQPPRLKMQTINGVQYGVALMKKVALFPTSSGTVTIEPMVMTLSVKLQGRSRDPFNRFFDDPFDDFFTRTQNIIRKTQPIELIILPLPETDKPATFNGNVGNFRMSADIDNNEVKQDDPITLTIKIQGTGNIKTVKEPVIKLPDSFKRYDPEITENVIRSQESLQGEKVFKSVIIPSNAGEYRIEPVQFSYFDPQRKSYWTVRSHPLNVVILPKVESEQPMERHIATKEEIKLLGKDIRFIKTDIPQLVYQGQYWYRTGLFKAMLVLPVFALIVAYGYKRYREKYRSDETYIRRKRAKKLSRHRFRTAAEMMDKGDTKEFYAAISQTLRQYIGDKLTIPPAGIEGEEISQVLKHYGLDEKTADLLKQCLTECDFARFAPGESSIEDMNSVLQNAELIITRIEKLKIQRSKPQAQGSKKLVLFLLLPFAFCLLPHLTCFAEMSAKQLLEATFQQGNAFYEAGKYSEALESYQSVIDSGFENGYVYYNFGNAQLKERRVGEAILAYERAKRLLPRDEDITFNLEYAKALTLDKMEQWYSGKIVGMLVAVRDYFTPNEISVVFLVMYLVLICLALAFMFTSRRWRIRIVYCSILPAFFFLLSGIMLFAQIHYRSSVTEAILLAPKAEAKTGPGEGYSAVFEIHEGAKVRLLRKKLEWVEIKLPNKVIGWVMKNDVEKIDLGG